jgi:hypothetical protein
VRVILILPSAIEIRASPSILRWRGGDVPARRGAAPIRGRERKKKNNQFSRPSPATASGRPLPFPWITTTPARPPASESEASQPSHGEGDRSAAGPPGAPPPLPLRRLLAASACGERPDLLLCSSLSFSRTGSDPIELGWLIDSLLRLCDGAGVGVRGRGQRRLPEVLLLRGRCRRRRVSLPPSCLQRFLPSLSLSDILFSSFSVPFLLM